MKLFAPKVRSWDNPQAQGYSQRGGPSPLAAGQTRAAAGRPMVPTSPFGGAMVKQSREFSRGAAADVVTLGLVSYNPIGAGRVVTGRIKPQNSKPGQYEAGQIFWTAQSAPTSVKLTGLQNPQALAAVLGPNYVKAVVRVNG